MYAKMNFMDLIKYEKKFSKRKKSHKKLKLFFVFATIILVTYSLLSTKIKSKNNSSSILISPLAPLEKSIKTFQAFFKPGLSDVIKKPLENTTGDYAVVIKELPNGKTFFYNEKKIFDSASLYKLWVMAVVYEELKKGNIKESDELTSEINYLNAAFNIATDSAELQDGEINLTVKQALEQMIVISHNYSALLLTDKVGISKISSFLRDEGFDSSSLGSPPKTDAEDIALFFEKLYKGKLIDKEYSKKMLDLLAKQQFNDRIPKLLPEGTKVAHKTGELDQVKHDAGIVYSPKKDYVVVIMSKTDNPDEAAGKMAEISKAVYDYFNE